MRRARRTESGRGRRARSSPLTLGDSVTQSIRMRFSVHTAAELANKNCDRAVRLAHKLSMELRSAGDRINQLESEIQLFQDRAARAEGWLQTIYKQIEEKLIAPRSASAPEQKLLP